MKKIIIDEKEFEIDCNALTHVKYKSFFKTGILKDMDLIQNYIIKQTIIANQLKEVTLIDISALSTDDLEKRIPYLDKLSECYGDIIDILSNNQTLPLNETKEHLHSILRNYFVSYDDTETYKIDFDKFKQFALNHNNNNQ